MNTDDIPYLTTLRTELVRGAEHSNRRRRRILFASPIAVGVVAAGTATAVFSLIGAAGPATQSADAAVLHQVRSAVTPPTGMILHEKAANTLGTLYWTYELWQSADTPHRYRVIKGPGEFSFDGNVIDDYRADTNTIVQEQPDGRTRSFDDPVAELRTLLDDGTARIVGTSTIDGRDVLQIDAHSSSNMLFNGTIYVDATSYQPVLAEVRQHAYDCGHTRPCAGIEQIRFLAYEYLPATTENLRLLSVTAQHPDATVAARTTTTTTTG